MNTPAQYDASKERPAVNDFAAWLNERRALPVAEAFHDIVQCYRSLHEQFIKASTNQQSQPLMDEPVAWLHQCRKKPELKKVSFQRTSKYLTSLGFAAIPLYAKAKS